MAQFADITSILDFTSLVILVATFALLHSTQKAFGQGRTKEIAYAVMLVSLGMLVSRVLAVVDVQIFAVQNSALYRAIVGIIVSLSLLIFAKKFSSFSQEVGFASKSKEISESDKRIAKALGA